MLALHLTVTAEKTNRNKKSLPDFLLNIIDLPVPTITTTTTTTTSTWKSLLLLAQHHN